jgi:hypothetical protein
MQRMKFNGWIRLWIVLSAIWMIAATVLSYNSLADILAKHEYKIEKDGVGVFTVVASRAQLRSDAEEYIKEKIIPRVSGKPAEYTGKSFSEPYNDYVATHLWRQVLKVVLFALAPVIGLFAFGCAVSWVWKGFRGSKTDA